MIPQLIKLFKTVAVAPGATLLDPVQVNAYAVRCGYFVMPDACTADCVTFLKTQEANLNTTFYKTWQDVTLRSELELQILQFIHYLSIYGTDYTGPTFTMNDNPAQIDYTKLTLIKSCTEQELLTRIDSMLSAPVALAGATLDVLTAQLDEFYRMYGWKVDIDGIANREAEVRLCRLYGELPSAPVRLVRYLVYVATGMSVIIKNAETHHRLEEGALKTVDEMGRIDENRLRGLASVFYRYKPVFLALKAGVSKALKRLREEQPWEKIEHAEPREVLIDKYTAYIATINKIRRMAPKYHRPMKAGVLESILAPEHSMADIAAAVQAETSLFKLVKLLNYIEYSRAEVPVRAYCIRNRKVYFKPTKAACGATLRLARLTELRRVVGDRITALLAAKATDESGRRLTVRLPEHIELAAPVSDNQMVGSVPYGSTYTLSANNYIGIYWRNEWGTRDFDLWLTDATGERIGWAADHKSADILFSGDMTNADPEATEIFYGRGSWPDSTVQVLRFNGEQGSLLRLFFGSDNLPSLPTGYMVNPDSIHFIEDLVSDNRDMTVALIHGGKVYFTAISSGNRQVPDTGKSVTAIGALADRLRSYVPLRDLLLNAGFVEYSTDSPTPPDIDLSDLDKDSLINLFTIG